MHDTLRVYADVGVLESGDRLSAAMTVGEHREDVARELLQLRVVGAAREYHERYSSPIGRPPAWSARPSTATASARSAYGKQKTRAKSG
jgi:hypothetical protein